MIHHHHPSSSSSSDANLPNETSGLLQHQQQHRAGVSTETGDAVPSFDDTSPNNNGSNDKDNNHNNNGMTMNHSSSSSSGGVRVRRQRTFTPDYDAIPSNVDSVTAATAHNNYQAIPSHSSVPQHYYRFTSSTMNPFSALRKVPDPGGQVTGLLRRSAVLPSHGTDPSGRWVLVSVGGRNGWAKRRILSNRNAGGDGGGHHHNFSAMVAGGFEPAHAFRQYEAWMGNHSFLCNGRVMLGSDAPLFFVTNVLLFGGVLGYLLAITPQVCLMHRVTCDREYYAVILLSIFSFVFLWCSAVIDPGILPACELC